jgi:hypothetical protein
VPCNIHNRNDISSRTHLELFLVLHYHDIYANDLIHLSHGSLGKNLPQFEKLYIIFGAGVSFCKDAFMTDRISLVVYTRDASSVLLNTSINKTETIELFMPM